VRSHGRGLLVRGGHRQNLFHVDLSGIISRIAGGAVSGFFSVRASFFKTFEREIGERVGDNEIANLIDRLVGGNQLFFLEGVSTP